jgi:selenocysteine-specific elongation factor
MKRARRGQSLSDDAPAALNPRQHALLERVSTVYAEAGCSPPPLRDVARDLLVPPHAIAGMLQIGAERGIFVEVTERLWFHIGAVHTAREMVRTLVQRDGSVSVGAFRDATGSSRKYAVPLLEYFDATGFTRRDGEVRILAECEAETPS